MLELEITGQAALEAEAEPVGSILEKHIWKPTVAADGSITWALSESEAAPAQQNIMGPQGATGATGAQGEKGDKGDTGATGATGAQGPKGDTGATGAQGPQGEKGDKGDPGEDGVSITNIAKTSTAGKVDTYTITLSDGTTTTFTVTNGNDGEDGEDGNGIASAVLNEDYTLTLTFTDGTSYTTTSIRGEQGEIGNGITNIVKTGTSGKVDTYTITLDNGATKTFTVTNGNDGADGQDGEDGTDGEDGFSPTVSTSTITGGHRVTITDATGAHTFDVMDGEDGVGVWGSITGTLSNQTDLSNALSAKEATANKVTSVSPSSTDTQYPSAKAMWDICNAKVDKSAQASKTSAMTQEIGIDANGKLWAEAGGGTWGSITGTLSDQTDLANALSEKEATANKVTSLSAQSTDTQYPSAKVTYDSIEDVREVAEGKTTSFVSSIAKTPALDSQNNLVEVTSFTTINDEAITYSQVKTGDNLYVTDIEVPDRWISGIRTTSTGRLPAEYREVEYLENAGASPNSIIDTGVINSSTIKTELKIKLNQTALDMKVYGPFNASNDYTSGFATYNGQWRVTGKPSTTLNQVILSTDAYNLYIDGTNVGELSATTPSKTIKIGCWLSEIGSYNPQMNIYYSKIWDNNVLIRELVPCYRVSDDETGMYDLVNNQFHQNTGTGTFIAGPTVSPIINYIQLSKLETAKVPVTDVQIGGTTIVNNSVANIPIAGNGRLGAVALGNTLGITIDGTNKLYVSKATNAEIEAKTQQFKPIVPTNLNKAVMEGLGNNALTWSDAYKTSARNTIGAEASANKVTSVSSSSTDTEYPSAKCVWDINNAKVDKSAQASKTSAMTQEIGIDANGKLWAEAGGLRPVVSVTVDTGAVVTATKGQTSVQATSASGLAVINLPEFGTWSFVATKSGKTSDTYTLVIDTCKTYGLSIVFECVYGVEWDKTASTVLSRTDDAALFADPVPYVLGATSYGSPFDDILPWSGMEIVDDAAAGKLVKIPKFYFKWTDSANSLKLQISATPISGFHTSPAHADRGDGSGERDYVYIGRYHCASDYKSKTGVSPKVSETRATFRSGIHSLGSNIWMNDFAMFWTTRMLYLVEYANWNCQATIGYGRGNGSAVESMGYTDLMPYHTGTMLASKTTYGVSTQYRYIEGLWDNCLDWCDGIRFSGRNVYCYQNPADCSDSTGGTLVYDARPTTSDFISNWNVPSVDGFEFALYPSAVDGGETTYIADKCSYSSSSVVLHVGGDYGQNQVCGLFFLSGYFGASGAYGGIGSRLQKLP